MNRLISGNFLLVLLLLGSTPVWARSGCGNLGNPYGPFDYTNGEDFATKLNIVEINHFTPDVEYLIKGLSGTIGGDLDYTLRAFPNHHRALYAMAQYQIREEGLAGAKFSADCYFQRAILFKPDDGVVRFVYGIYLHKIGDHANALKEYLLAEQLTPNSAELHYDMGLLYLDMRDFEAARLQAKKAYAGGYQLQGLKNRLIAEGQWQETEVKTTLDAPVKPEKQANK